MAEAPSLAWLLEEGYDPFADRDLTTADILAGMKRRDGFTGLLRNAADKIPANTEHGFSMLNMAKGGINSAANWLDSARPTQISENSWDVSPVPPGPDTLAPLAPLGLAGMGALATTRRLPASTVAEVAPRFSLSPNTHSLRSEGLFKYDILRDGKKVGYSKGSVDGDTAYISWIGENGQANRIGPAGILQLREGMYTFD